MSIEVYVVEHVDTRVRELKQADRQVMIVDLFNIPRDVPNTQITWKSPLDEREAFASAAESYQRLRNQYKTNLSADDFLEFTNGLRYEPFFPLMMGVEGGKFAEDDFCTVTPNPEHKGVVNVRFRYGLNIADYTKRSEIIPKKFGCVWTRTAFGSYDIQRNFREHEVIQFGRHTIYFVPAEIVQLYNNTGIVRLNQEDLWDLHSKLSELLQDLSPLELLASK